jgi:hypothetical protein
MVNIIPQKFRETVTRAYWQGRNEAQAEIEKLKAEIEELKNRQFSGSPYTQKQLEQMGNPNYVTAEGWISWE